MILLVSDKENHRIFTGTDFRPQYTAVTMAKNHVRSDFYSLETQFKWQRKIAPELQQRYRLLPFISTPVGIAVLSPLSFFTIETAYRIWGFINIVLCLLICKLLIGIYKTQKDEERIVNNYELAVIVISFFPLWGAIWQGQFSVIYTIAFVGSYVLTKKKKYFLAGLLLTLLSIKPHLVILPFFMFLWRKDWAIVRGMVAGFIFWGIVSLSLIGAEGIAAYLKLLATIPSWGNMMGISPELQPTLKGFLHTIFSTLFLSPEQTLLWIGLCTLALAYLLDIWRTAIPGKITDKQWTWLIVVLIFVSPHTHFHDLSILLLPLTLWLKYMFSPKSKSAIGNTISKYKMLKVLLFCVILFAPLTLRQLSYIPGMLFAIYLLYVFIFSGILSRLNLHKLR